MVSTIKLIPLDFWIGKPSSLSIASTCFEQIIYLDYYIPVMRIILSCIYYSYELISSLFWYIYLTNF